MKVDYLLSAALSQLIAVETNRYALQRSGWCDVTEAEVCNSDGANRLPRIGNCWTAS